MLENDLEVQQPDQETDNEPDFLGGVQACNIDDTECESCQ